MSTDGASLRVDGACCQFAAERCTGTVPDPGSAGPVPDGRDPQLEAAVAEALRLLETETVELLPEPPPPVRYRRPGGP